MAKKDTYILDRFVRFLGKHISGQDALCWQKEGEDTFFLPIREGRLCLQHFSCSQWASVCQLTLIPREDAGKPTLLQGFYSTETVPRDSNLHKLYYGLCAEQGRTPADPAREYDLAQLFPHWKKLHLSAAP